MKPQGSTTPSSGPPSAIARCGLPCKEDDHEYQHLARQDHPELAPHHAGLHVRLPQQFRDGGAARRIADRAQFAATLRLRALCRTAFRLAVHGAARQQRTLLAVSDQAFGKAFRTFCKSRCRAVAHRAVPRAGDRDRAVALGSDADPENRNDVPAGRADHDHGGRRRHAGRHGSACLSHHQIDGRSAFLQCRRRDDVRAAAGNLALGYRIRPDRCRARRDRGDSARRQIPRRDPGRAGARLSLRELRRRLHAAGARANRRQLPCQRARFPHARSCL